MKNKKKTAGMTKTKIKDLIKKREIVETPNWLRMPKTISPSEKEEDPIEDYYSRDKVYFFFEDRRQNADKRTKK